MILFERYRAVGVLGEGAFGTVYLVEHLTLGGLRAVKVSEKGGPQGFKLLEEGKLLMRLNHPGIPKVYDLSEDEKYVYLVEEYIWGESLDVFLHHQKHISVEFTAGVCQELCNLVSYLRHSKAGEVYHRDIKPEHVVFTEDGLKLLDYGNAVKNKEEVLFYGKNRDICESVEDEDLRAIREIATLMLKNNSQRQARSLLGIMKKSEEKSPESLSATFQRFIASDVCEARKVISNGEAPESIRENSHFKKRVTVGGSEKHIGATHFSISFEVYLRQSGVDVLYEEKDDKHSLTDSAKVMGWSTQENGIYLWQSFRGVPNYGPGVLCDTVSSEIVIEDYGTREHEMNADMNILILGSRPWEFERSYHLIKELKGQNVIYICMNGDLTGAKELANHTGEKIYCYPSDSDPFHLNKEKILFFDQLLSGKGVFDHKTNDNCCGRFEQWLRSNTLICGIGKLSGFGKR
ncbi:MAG: protein kinase [Lachnospiraceae bacterium]|nr:protein kinase [Lachnospiraceae bacterium]